MHIAISSADALYMNYELSIVGIHPDDHVYHTLI